MMQVLMQRAEIGDGVRRFRCSHPRQLSTSISCPL